MIRSNIETFGAEGTTRLFRRDATKLGPMGPGAPYGLVFCDPPYGRNLAPAALASAAAGGWLAPDALVVVEESGSAAVTLPEGFQELERRSYGETAVVLGRFGVP